MDNHTSYKIWADRNECCLLNPGYVYACLLCKHNVPSLSKSDYLFWDHFLFRLFSDYVRMLQYTLNTKIRSPTGMYIIFLLCPE